MWPITALTSGVCCRVACHINLGTLRAPFLRSDLGREIWLNGSAIDRQGSLGLRGRGLVA